MWNPFKKSNKNSKPGKGQVDLDDQPKMNMLQRIAMKKLEKMSPKERERMMADMFKPENKDKILQTMEMMRKTGQITESQYNEAKQKMGL